MYITSYTSWCWFTIYHPNITDGSPPCFWDVTCEGLSCRIQRDGVHNLWLKRTARVVWNMCYFSQCHNPSWQSPSFFPFFHFLVEIHNPNWRSPSFFRGVGLNHQPEPTRWCTDKSTVRNCLGKNESLEEFFVSIVVRNRTALIILNWTSFITELDDGKGQQETPIFFHGKNPWFPVKIFPRKPSHWFKHSSCPCLCEVSNPWDDDSQINPYFCRVETTNQSQKRFRVNLQGPPTTGKSGCENHGIGLRALDD